MGGHSPRSVRTSSCVQKSSVTPVVGSAQPSSNADQLCKYGHDWIRYLNDPLSFRWPEQLSEAALWLTCCRHSSLVCGIPTQSLDFVTTDLRHMLDGEVGRLAVALTKDQTIDDEDGVHHRLPRQGVCGTSSDQKAHVAARKPFLRSTTNMDM